MLGWNIRDKWFFNVCTYLLYLTYTIDNRDLEWLVSFKRTFSKVCTEFDSGEILGHKQSLACNGHLFMWRPWSFMLNPFTAMLAVLSLLKQPLKVPNLKSLKPFLPFTWAHKRISIKMRSIECRLVVVPSNMLFAGVYVCTFQPGNFTSSGSEGFKI